MADITKDLYRLIGSYESTTEQINKELQEIKKELKELNKTNSEAHDAIKACISDVEKVVEKNTETINHNDRRIQEFEKSGVPKTTNQKIDSALLLAVFNTILEIVKALINAF